MCNVSNEKLTMPRQLVQNTELQGKESTPFVSFEVIKLNNQADKQIYNIVSIKPKVHKTTYHRLHHIKASTKDYFTN